MSAVKSYKRYDKLIQFHGQFLLWLINGDAIQKKGNRHTAIDQHRERERARKKLCFGQREREKNKLKSIATSSYRHYECVRGGQKMKQNAMEACGSDDANNNKSTVTSVQSCSIHMKGK